MFCIIGKKLRRLYSRIRWLIWRKRRRPPILIKKFKKLSVPPTTTTTTTSTANPNTIFSGFQPQTRPIRFATFNAALFSLAPAVPNPENPIVFVHEKERKSVENHPKSILKHSPLHPQLDPSEPNKTAKSKHKVSINLQDNEITLAQNKVLSIVRSPLLFPWNMSTMGLGGSDDGGFGRTVFDVLNEVDADVLALQDVKAEEEKEMRPLSDLAKALGMNYVFADSWAPEYGNAILSKWPIKRSKIQKIFDDNDFRNVLKATIDVPWAGEVNFHCTQLDHLDENWRKKQIEAMIKSNDVRRPHILAGGLNSLDGSDYSEERWAEIVRYFEEIGKPTPKDEVVKFLKGKDYVDAKNFAGECEPVVIIAKGQNVQGTCKYGTRVDYILASSSSSYKFVPGSYSVVSSKGTSDHHIVKVDMVKAGDHEISTRICRVRHKKLKKKMVRIITSSSCSCSSRGIWRI